MSRRKPMAALAAATAAVAIAIPASGASAATPVARNAPFGAHGLYEPGSPSCQLLVRRVRFFSATGVMPAANLFSNVFVYSGCGGAAI